MAWVPPGALTTWLNPEHAPPLPARHPPRAFESPPVRAAPLVVTRQPAPTQSPVTEAARGGPWLGMVVREPALIWPAHAVLPVQATRPFAVVAWPAAERPVSVPLHPPCGHETWE